MPPGVTRQGSVGHGTQSLTGLHRDDLVGERLETGNIALELGDLSLETVVFERKGDVASLDNRIFESQMIGGLDCRFRCIEGFLKLALDKPRAPTPEKSSLPG